ncbi:MAG: hypothetical protein L0Z07_03705 [Planctomycetes bacterium]|nr:hypothetical protein [Planctomycetota bacterium]
MNRCEWIVCERTSRWASALRIALARASPSADFAPLLHEVRSLSELGTRLERRPAGLAIVEVYRDQAGQILDWIGNATQQFPSARFVAALDTSLIPPSTHPTQAAGDGWRDVADALFEAGIVEVVDSPRCLQGVLAIGRRHAATCAGRRQGQEGMSAVEAVWASLPWQDG